VRGRIFDRYQGRVDFDEFRFQYYQAFKCLMMRARNGFFSAVKNQHVKETKCIAMGDPYCEWEFR
jgi:hypothetical protein